MEISPFTDDYATAVSWFTDQALSGIEGLVIKAMRSRYTPGQRAGLKIKSKRELDAVAGAVIGPEAIVAGPLHQRGRPRDPRAQHTLTNQQAMEPVAVLIPIPAAEHPWPAMIGAGHFGGAPVAITHVQPTAVIEIAADTALQGGRHRHPIR